MKNNRKGFTLVELLVVIAIIGLLATIAFIALNQARSKARDAKRISDVREMQSALELFYNDQQTPAYPTGSSALMSSAILGSTYVATVPTAPLPVDGSCTAGTGSNDYTYTAYTGSSLATTCTTANTATPCGWYTLTFCLGSATGGLPSGVHTATPSGIN